MRSLKWPFWHSLALSVLKVLQLCGSGFKRVKDLKWSNILKVFIDGKFGSFRPTDCQHLFMFLMASVTSFTLMRRHNACTNGKYHVRLDSIVYSNKHISASQHWLLEKKKLFYFTTIGVLFKSQFSQYTFFPHIILKF